VTCHNNHPGGDPRDLRKSLVQTLLKEGSAMRSDQVAEGLSSQVLKPSKDGDCIMSLNNLFHCLTVLIY